MDPSKGVRDKLEMVGYYRSKFGVGNREKVAVKSRAYPLEQLISQDVLLEDLT